MGKTDEKLDQAKTAMVERLLSDMEVEGADWVRDWADCGTPFNPVTGTVYRGRNALLLMCAIAAEGLADPRFMTFAQAKAAGYKVRKGCHGHPIEKWREMWFSRADPTAREELIAEMCCMFTAAALGTRMPKACGDREYWANHVSYIRSWLKACGDDAAAEVMRAATAAANASDWLMRNCFPVEQAEAEPEALTA